MGEVDSVQAMTALLVHERIEVEDTAVAAVRFKNGALGVIEASTGAYPGLLKRTEIHGENGSARVEQDDVTLWTFRDERPGDLEMLAPKGASTGGAADPKAISHAGHRDQLSDFLRAIDTGTPALVDGREGRKAVEIIRAIYRSSRLGTAVRLPFEDAEGTGPA
jgi:predicted dehydrogenase